MTVTQNYLQALTSIWKQYKPAKRIMDKFGYSEDEVLSIDNIEGITVFNKK